MTPQHLHKHASRNLRLGASTLAAASLLALVACASVPAPTEQLAVSTAAIAHAAAAGGQGTPPADLGLARDKLQRANRAMADKDHDRARRLAQQAELDALVAESRLETAKARLAAQEVQTAAQALSEELARKKP